MHAHVRVNILGRAGWGGDIYMVQGLTNIPYKITHHMNVAKISKGVSTVEFVSHRGSHLQLCDQGYMSQDVHG